MLQRHIVPLSNHLNGAANMAKQYFEILLPFPVKLKIQIFRNFEGFLSLELIFSVLGEIATLNEGNGHQ